MAGFAVALGAGAVARATDMKEDAALAAFYLTSLALGVMLVSLRGSNVDLLHVLFGTVLALDDATLLLIVSISSITVLMLAVLWRPFGAGMRRSRLPALGQPGGRAFAPRFPGAWWC